ncbi:MAG: cytochrome c oxidase subunit II transmembrane domain-containing protein, partial [Rhodothalassiaceae bacterium]
MTGKRMGALVALAVAMTANVAAGQEISKAQDGQMGFMAPATPVMERIESFHNELLVIITAICVLVALL